MSESEKDQRKSGRAVFDEGRTVWEWQTATGVFQRHVSDEQMSRLEASDLRLVEQSSPMDTGRAIYSSSGGSHMDTGARPRVQPRRNVGAFRQLWRRLVPAS